MKIVKDKISKNELQKMAKNMFGNFVKAVVDVEKEILAVDAELHADLEALLLERGSRQENLWGINLYPELKGDDSVEFDSMINIKPRQNNRSRDVESSEIQEKIIVVVNKLIAE
jgi:hypothetical protein